MTEDERDLLENILAVKNKWEMELLAVCSVIDSYPVGYEGVAEELRGLRDRWQALWQASEKRAEQAEAQIIPVADRERALELAGKAGQLAEFDSPIDRHLPALMFTEARRLLRLP